MPFTLLKLLFAALVVALLVIILLIARQVLRKGRRKAPAAKFKKVAESPKPRASMGRKKTEPEPEPTSPPPPRRRQLQSFVESERITEPSLPLPPIAEPEEPAPPPPPPPPTAFVDEPLPTADEPEEDFDVEVLQRLEGAFEALQDGAVTLEGYRRLLLAEERRVERHIALLEPAGDSPELQSALTARESVLWCLDWADQQAGGPRQ